MILVDKRGWFWIIWHQIGTPSESCDFHTTASGVRVVWKWGKRGGSGLEMGLAGWEWSGNGANEKLLVAYLWCGSILRGMCVTS